MSENSGGRERRCIEIEVVDRRRKQAAAAVSVSIELHPLPAMVLIRRCQDDVFLSKMRGSSFLDAREKEELQ